MYPLKIKEKYISANLTNLGHRFTTTYLGTYISGDFSEGNGSHPGVDIMPEKKGQDVFSVLDGTVFKAGEEGAYGKFVFIEHKNAPNPDDLSKTTTVYSCYLHLSEVIVKTGDILKEGDKIGNTGNTGNSFGEHLHFQIDKQEAPFHAYWPFTGAESKTAGLSFTTGVNKGLGVEKARIYTINPLIYLDKVDEFRKLNPIKKEIKIETIKTETVKTETIKTETIKVEPVIEVLKTKVEINTPKLETIINCDSSNMVINNPVIIEEKKETIILNNNIVLSDQTKDMFASFGLEDDKKKTLMI